MISPRRRTNLLSWLKTSNRRPIVVASYPRSGTHLLIDTMRLNFRECSSWKLWGEPLDRLYLNLGSYCSANPTISETQVVRILSRSHCPIIKTHAACDFRSDAIDEESFTSPDPALIACFRDNSTFLYSYRDGRQVMCSVWLMHLATGRDVPKTVGEFMRESRGGVSRLRHWISHVETWLATPGVYGVSMERLLKDPSVVMQQVAARIGLACDPATLRLPRPHDTLFEGRVLRLFSTRPESTTIIVSLRGKWQEYFTDADREYFDREAGDLMTRLGYYTSGDPAPDVKAALHECAGTE